MKNNTRIIFFGTPEFAVASLEALIHANYNVVGVVTVPDKQAGRGMKYNSSAVKQFAIRNDLFLLQPDNLEDSSFYNSLKSLKPELQVVVAFRLLPKAVWALAPLGTFNLHASLLPQYRGAAPINWVIINGENETGVTTFFLDEKIDTGEIIFQQKMLIDREETAGKLHDRLMRMGADLVLKTVDAIIGDKVMVVSQEFLLSPGLILNKAPKIKKEHCRINWNDKVTDIYNLIRGMSPHPGAFTTIQLPDGGQLYLKVYKALPEFDNHSMNHGQVITDGRLYFKIAASGGFIQLIKVQAAGRKTMQIGDFLRGYGRYFV
jgi:methionyl-tRNA formyltransferase